MKLRKDIAVSEAGLVFNPNTGESFSVNPIGIEILALLREDKDFEEICGKITEKYSTTRDDFERDFGDFMEVLSQYQLLVGDEKKNA